MMWAIRDHRDEIAHWLGAGGSDRIVELEHPDQVTVRVLEPRRPSGADPPDPVLGLRGLVFLEDDSPRAKNDRHGGVARASH
jgi:hypothetical protein